MKREDIEHMWKVASNNPNHDTNWFDPVVIRFAALVASAEREYLRESFRVVTAAEASAAILHEREACAKVCDAWQEWGADGALLAKAIRARGQA
jgi:hypothetical protein